MRNERPVNEFRTCKKCGEEKPLTKVFWRQQNPASPRLNFTCKTCSNARNVERARIRRTDGARVREIDPTYDPTLNEKRRRRRQYELDIDAIGEGQEVSIQPDAWPKESGSPPYTSIARLWRVSKYSVTVVAYYKNDECVPVVVPLWGLRMMRRIADAPPLPGWALDKEST